MTAIFSTNPSACPYPCCVSSPTILSYAVILESQYGIGEQCYPVCNTWTPASFAAAGEAAFAPNWSAITTYPISLSPTQPAQYGISFNTYYSAAGNDVCNSRWSSVINDNNRAADCYLTASNGANLCFPASFNAYTDYVCTPWDPPTDGFSLTGGPMTWIYCTMRIYGPIAEFCIEYVTGFSLGDVGECGIGGSNTGTQYVQYEAIAAGDYLDIAPPGDNTVGIAITIGACPS